MAHLQEDKKTKHICCISVIYMWHKQPMWQKLDRFGVAVDSFWVSGRELMVH